MTLVARDEGGNVGKSEPFAFRLPERVFTKPLARALIEQRRNLALDANARPLVITALDALSLAPEKFTPEAGIYLGLRCVFWSLVRAKTDDDLRDVVARLWQMAVVSRTATFPTRKPHCAMPRRRCSRRSNAAPATTRSSN